MEDIYCLKIEVDMPGQMKLIDLILDVEHDVEEAGVWVLTMEYEEAWSDLPLYYISNFMNILRGKYGDLEKIGIKREQISIWRCITGPQEVYMEYWPEEMRLMASEGIRFRLLCHIQEEEEGQQGSPHFGSFPVLN